MDAEGRVWVLSGEEVVPMSKRWLVIGAIVVGVVVLMLVVILVGGDGGGAGSPGGGY